MTSARIAVQHEDAWNSAAYQNLVGTTLSYPAFSGLEEDPIIKELGGLKYFCGKDEAALSGVCLLYTSGSCCRVVHRIPVPAEAVPYGWKNISGGSHEVSGEQRRKEDT